MQNGGSHLTMPHSTPAKGYAELLRVRPWSGASDLNWCFSLTEAETPFFHISWVLCLQLSTPWWLWMKNSQFQHPQTASLHLAAQGSTLEKNLLQNKTPVLLSNTLHRTNLTSSNSSSLTMHAQRHVSAHMGYKWLCICLAMQTGNFSCQKFKNSCQPLKTEHTW